MSIGFANEASLELNVRSFLTVFGDSAGMSRPLLISASVARMPGPPALVTTTTRLPFGKGWVDNALATSNSSSTVSTRITPVWLNSASTPTSRPARAPVCDDAALAPSVVRPDFTATIGLTRETSRAISVK